MHRRAVSRQPFRQELARGVPDRAGQEVQDAAAVLDAQGPRAVAEARARIAVVLGVAGVRVVVRDRKVIGKVVLLMNGGR